MLKRLIVPVVVFVALLSMAFYATNNEVSEETIPVDLEELADEGDYEPIVVMELFTSQGCSSCPPADELLEKIKKENNKDVFALSYHVDYWNYIGWKDPFSKADYTELQRRYNVKFRSRSNYTPQLVVNGREHFVGSNSSKAFSSIRSYKELNSEHKIGVSISEVSGDKISFNYNVEGNSENTLLRAVLVLDERTTNVKRGENRNRILKNSNIVISQKYIPVDKGSYSLSIPSLVKPGEKMTLVLISENGSLNISGAAKVAVNVNG